MEITIKRRALLSALAGAKAASPNEFICLLTGTRDKGTNTIVIDDTMIPPGIMVSASMSSFSEWMLPTVSGLLGIFHSHPGSHAHPSRQDARLFGKKGGINLIAAPPFEIGGVLAFIWTGEQVPFRVVD